MDIASYLLLALLFCTARRANGWAAFHDLATKTRVISRTTRQVRLTPAIAEASPPAIEAKPLIGPFHVLDTLQDSAGTAWLLGYDLRLLRKVWIRTVPAGAPPVADSLRNLSRVGRLRWLAGRRGPEENWDAFEALSGQPLLRLLDTGPVANPQPWAQVRFWLFDLATELSAVQKDGSLPPLLALDRVWIAGDGRAKLLDFPAPGIPASFANVTSSPASNITDAPRFLGQVAAAALEGRAEAAAKPAGEVSIRLPLHVRQFFKDLPQVLDADSLLLALRPLLQRVVVVTRLRRAAMVAACIILPSLLPAGGALLFPSFLGPMGSMDVGKFFELSELLHERSAMRLPAKNQPTLADRQFAVYIASHFSEIITNQDAWVSGPAPRFIKGDDRRFAEESVKQYPAPSTHEMAEADAAIKALLPRLNDKAGFRCLSACGLLMLGLFAFYAALPALILALAFRGGPVSLLADVAFVRRDGAPASRARLTWRAFLIGSPLWAALPASIMLFTTSADAISLVTWALAVALLLGLPLLYLVLSVLSLALPRRGLQDRLAGTWPVMR